MTFLCTFRGKNFVSTVGKMALEYSDVHRGFLQVLMSRGCISESNAQTILGEILMSCQDADTSAEEGVLQDVINQINEKIRQFDQKIEIVTSLYDDKVFVVFINTAQSAIMKIQSTYKPHDVEFFRLLMKEIALAENHSVRQIAVLNLMNQNRIKDFTMSRSEKLLDQWIEEGYFYVINGLVHFGVRAVAEFGEFLRTKFNETVAACYLCKSVLFKGIDCNGTDCDGFFHALCIRKYMAKNSKCPKCKKVWDVPTS